MLKNIMLSLAVGMPILHTAPILAAPPDAVCYWQTRHHFARLQ
jgi:hypothetical protein